MNIRLKYIFDDFYMVLVEINPIAASHFTVNPD